MNRALLACVACCFLASNAETAWATAHTRTSTSIAMRDSPYTLAADVYLPPGAGPWPAVLIQTPYNKNAFAPQFTLDLDNDPLLESPDYAFVVLDWRGFYGSASAAYSGSPTHGEDGYDAVEWIAGQSWCSGKVGTWGASALGVVQFLTAREKPPHLTACVPIVSHPEDTYDLYYGGGVYFSNKNGFVSTYFGGGNLYKQHPTLDVFWNFLANNGYDFSQVSVPMLHITGWYDHETATSIAAAQAVQSSGGAGAQGQQHLYIGPWTHEGVGDATQGQLDYSDAAHDSSQEALDFFDYYLRSQANGYPSRPFLRYYRLNAAEWVSAPSWPPAGTTTRTYYLAPGNLLDLDAPTGNGVHSTFISDPANPVPTIFGAILITTNASEGPGDLASLIGRSDTLAFATSVLTSPLTIEGTATIRAFVSSDTSNVDVTARLLDVLPDNRAMLVVDMARRASLRNGYATRELLTPGQIYEVDITLPPVSLELPTGHRLEILIASSNYDRFEVNPQDGHDFPDDSGAVMTTAHVALYTDASHPSRIELPVIPIEGEGEGVPEGNVEGNPEGAAEGNVEGAEEGEGTGIAPNGEIVGPSSVAEGQPFALTVSLHNTVGAISYRWLKDSQELADELLDTYSVSAATKDDAGIYVCEFTDGSKSVQTTPPFNLEIISQSSLPVSGAAGLGILAALIGAVASMHKKRRP